MPFKIPNSIPTLRDSPQEWADYAEYTAIKLQRVSFFDLIKNSLLIGDEVVVDGVEDDTDRYNNKADDISTEISYRMRIMNGKYPFSLANRDYSLEFNNRDYFPFNVYKFLLLATRLNMTNNKVQADVDGSLAFEKLSVEIALSFFGANTAADVLGTSNANLGGFRAKLTNIVERLNEGGPIHDNPGYRPQDDKVDIIAWKGFSDKQSSQLIAFGQCKTGTSWQNSLSELNPIAFCNTWFTRQPVLSPVRLFFCAQYFPKDIWYARAARAGLVFDRFRIIDYLPDQFNPELTGEINSWTVAATALHN